MAVLWRHWPKLTLVSLISMEIPQQNSGRRCSEQHGRELDVLTLHHHYFTPTDLIKAMHSKIFEETRMQTNIEEIYERKSE